MMYTARFLSTEEKRKSCRLHGGIRFEGVDAIQKVLISSETFTNRTVSGKMAPFQRTGPGIGDVTLIWPLHNNKARAEKQGRSCACLR